MSGPVAPRSEAVLPVLLVHNHYGSSAPSGENAVFQLERALLADRGHQVVTFERFSDDIRGRGVLGLMKGALVTPWNPLTARAVRRVTERLGPGAVLHAHNTFPLVSPSVFHGAGSNVARVLTLHNYRLFCPAAIPLRDGQPCTLCLERQSVLPALRYGCYRKSRIATVPVAASVALHRALGTWERQVDAFVALTEFQRRLMIAGGLPADRVFVKPNHYPGRPEVVPWSARRRAVVFAGRLSEEKGVTGLVDAWVRWGNGAPELRVLGDGPLRAELERRARAAGAHVHFQGQLPPAEADEEIARARLLVVPSVCFEGFPMVLREAFARGTPAAVSDRGPLPDIVAPAGGAVFPGGDTAGIERTLRTVWGDPVRLEQMGRSARAEYEKRYTEDASYAALVAIYRRAREVRDSRPAG